jgi:hypothetical protein
VLVFAASWSIVLAASEASEAALQLWLLTPLMLLML